MRERAKIPGARLPKEAALYLGDADLRSPGAWLILSDLSGLPPTYAIVGGGVCARRASGHRGDG